MKISNIFEMKKYRFYKNKNTDKTWWVDNRGVKGEMLFSFNKRKIYNLFRDYPYELSLEEKEIFDKENPYWADFFKDRNNELKQHDVQKIDNDLYYEQRKVEEYFLEEERKSSERQVKLEKIKNMYFKDNEVCFESVKNYLNESFDFDLLNNYNGIRFELCDKVNNKKLFFAIDKNMFVINNFSKNKLNIRGNSSEEKFLLLVSQLKEITKSWDIGYLSDGEYYWGLSICLDNKRKIFIGKSKFPDNWADFTKSLNSIIDELLNNNIKYVLI